MIAIQVGTDYLDLMPSTNVNFKLNSSFFEQNEEAVSSYSLPFTVPRTPQNERIFKYISLAEIQDNQALFDCQVFLYNMPYKKGTIEVLSWDEQTYKITIFVELSQFLLKMEGSLKTLDLGTVNLINPFFMQDYIQNSLVHTWSDACVFPEMVANEFIEGFGYDGYINDYDEANSEYHDFLVGPYLFVPFLFVRYVLEKIQLFCNCIIEGDFMDNIELQKILIVNNYTINEWIESPGGFTLSTQIDFINHVPDISIRKFLALLADILNYSIDYDEVENKIIFVKKYSVFQVGNYVDYSKQFITYKEGETVNTQEKYKIKFFDDVFQEHPVYNNGEKVEKIELGASTLQTYFVPDRVTSKLDSIAASRQFSETATFSSSSPTAENTLRFVFWQGLQPNVNGSAPQSTHYTPVTSPTIILDPLELYNNQFIKFIKAKETTKKYTARFLFSVTDILNFNINKPIRVNSVTFIPTEASINTTLQGTEPVEITMYRI
jgi:hypothetical protein